MSSANNDNLRHPKIILRSYQDKDKDAVNDLFATTYYGLVLEGVRSKLWAPMTWVIWLGGYSALMTVVPTMVFGPVAAAKNEFWSVFLLKLAISAVWAAFGFAFLFIKTVRWDAMERVEEAKANDLSDPARYYFDTNLSHFWVLEVDQVLSGMVALAFYEKRFLNKRPDQGKPWQQIGAAVCRRLFGERRVPAVFRPRPSPRPRVFAEPTEPKTAILDRLAIDHDYQNCGLSTLLINRAMLWAHEKGIEKVYATTNEMQIQAEQVLTRRHGFKMLRKDKIGALGKYEALLVADVKEWMDTHGKDTKSLYKRV